MPNGQGLVLTNLFQINTLNMAKTEAGKKIVYVRPYTYTNKSEKTVKVGQRYRSTPN